jgi:hypothetical protein
MQGFLIFLVIANGLINLISSHIIVTKLLKTNKENTDLIVSKCNAIKYLERELDEKNRLLADIKTNPSTQPNNWDSVRACFKGPVRIEHERN